MLAMTPKSVYNKRMSESGPTNLPVGVKSPGQSVPTQAELKEARIIGVPNELRDVRVKVKLQGKITQRHTDGSLTVRTEQGDVRVQPAKDTPPPRQGQHVEIEVQRGAPPKTAKITPVKTPEQAPQTEAPRTTRTPVNIEVNVPKYDAVQAYTQTPRAQGQTPPPSNPIAHSEVIRLTPITPQQAAQAAQNVQLPPLIAHMVQTIEAPVQQAIQLTAFEAMQAPLTLDAPQTNARMPLQRFFTPQAPLQITPQTGQSPPEFLLLPPSRASLLSKLSSLTPQATPQVTKPGAPQPYVLQIENLPQNLPSALLPAAANRLSLPITTTPDAAPAPQPLAAFLDVRIQEIETPLTRLTAPTQSAAAPTLEELLPPRALEALITKEQSLTTTPAILTGLTEENFPVFSFTDPQTGQVRSFSLNIPVETVTQGAQIQLSAQTLSAAPIAAPVMPLSTYLTPGQWPMMQELHQSLAQIQPATAQILSAMTPSPSSPAQMMPAALFFLAAARGGDITGWLGDKAMDILRGNSRSNLLSRLTGENGLLSRLGAEPASQDWRAMALPFFADQEMQKIALYYRQESGGEDTPEHKGKQMRFVFDLNLSNMGSVQLDGLFHPGRLDVILRTQQPFSQAMQMEMRQLYARGLKSASDTAPITGELTFQNQPDQWVKINVAETSKENVIA